MAVYHSIRAKISLSNSCQLSGSYVSAADISVVSISVVYISASVYAMSPYSGDTQGGLRLTNQRETVANKKTRLFCPKVGFS